ncbi:hypothetical protein [Streptomonospora nanhaiensis]|uniref:hypothetical protein n=1 Tax=Streptomonospora nanhaiensis TaxID=1323731 RepID=UPI0020CB2ED9|nr:hypothetical protein [Streptomonospora nanhaiensis]
MRRVGALVVSALLVAGVAVAAVWNLWGSSPTVVSGVIGSEKATFFADPQVVERLAELGYEADIRTGGSREIATTDLDGVDFAFPSSDPSAEVLRRNNAVERVYRPFYSPMVVLSYRPVAEALARAGVARRAQDGAWDLDMAAYLDLTEERTRWRDLPGDALGGAGRGEVLIRTTDPRTSNSAAMYLVVVSYLLNGEEVVTDAAAEPGLVEEAARLFLAQGSPPAPSSPSTSSWRWAPATRRCCGPTSSSTSPPAPAPAAFPRTSCCSTPAPPPWPPTPCSRSPRRATRSAGC